MIENNMSVVPCQNGAVIRIAIENQVSLLSIEDAEWLTSNIQELIDNYRVNHPISEEEK